MLRNRWFSSFFLLKWCTTWLKLILQIFLWPIFLQLSLKSRRFRFVFTLFIASRKKLFKQMSFSNTRWWLIYFLFLTIMASSLSLRRRNPLMVFFKRSLLVIILAWCSWSRRPSTWKNALRWSNYWLRIIVWITA